METDKRRRPQGPVPRDRHTCRIRSRHLHVLLSAALIDLPRAQARLAGVAGRTAARHVGRRDREALRPLYPRRFRGPRAAYALTGTGHRQCRFHRPSVVTGLPEEVWWAVIEAARPYAPDAE